MILRAAIVLLAFVGCGPPTAPYVQVIADDPELAARGVEAVFAWSELGFDGGIESTGNDECAENWYSNSWARSECQITIRLAIEVGMRNINVDGYHIGHTDQETRVITLDDLLAAPGGNANHLDFVLIHEIGHVVLDCGHLTMPTDVGIMRPKTSGDVWPTVPSQDDLDLACRSIGICRRLAP